MFVYMTVGTISDIHCKCKHCIFAVTTFNLIHTVKKHWAKSQECFMLSREYNSMKFAHGRAFRHSNIQWGDLTESTYVANWSIVAGSEVSYPLARNFQKSWMDRANCYILGCTSVPVTSLGEFLVIFSLASFGHFSQFGWIFNLWKQWRFSSRRQHSRLSSEATATQNSINNHNYPLSESRSEISITVIDIRNWVSPYCI